METMSQEVKLESIIEDFEPGDRVKWLHTRNFATVLYTIYGKLYLNLDNYGVDILVVSDKGVGDSPGKSTIAQWSKFPRFELLETGMCLSTVFGEDRQHYTITAIGPGNKISVVSNDEERHEFVIQGDNFSRTLEDQLSEWELEG